jgi:nucleoside-diphosphate-sugar epimerase
MKIFVTGASGFIGSAVVPELLNAGHRVFGLARSDEAAQRLLAAGAEVQSGALEDLESLRAGAEKADGVIHLAFIHDFSRYEAAAQADTRAIEVMGAALEGTGKPLVNASGLLGVLPGRVVTEEAPPAAWGRGNSERVMQALAQRGVRSAVVRLPPSVHGAGDHGFVPHLITTARQSGVSAYPEDGSNRWPAVHRLDAARLFRLAIERAPAGAILHAAADEGVTTRAIAEVIARRLGVPLASKSKAESAHFGFLGGFVGLDAPASSTRTRELLGWQPAGPGLLEDVDSDHYFSS